MIIEPANTHLTAPVHDCHTAKWYVSKPKNKEFWAAVLYHGRTVMQFGFFSSYAATLEYVREEITKERARREARELLDTVHLSDLGHAYGGHPEITY